MTTSKELKIEGDKCFWKYDATDKDMEEAIVYFKKSMASFDDNTMQVLEQAGCYNILTEAILKKSVKSKNDFDEIISNLDAMGKLRIPSWLNTLKITQLLINPKFYGYDDELKNKKLAIEYFEKTMKRMTKDDFQMALYGMEYNRTSLTDDELDMLIIGYDYCKDKQSYYGQGVQSFTRLGVLYSHYMPKTKENYYKALENYDIVINLNHQKCTPIMSLIYASMLTSSSSHLGFPKELLDDKLSNNYISKLEEFCSNTEDKLAFREAAVLYHTYGVQFTLKEYLKKAIFYYEKHIKFGIHQTQVFVSRNFMASIYAKYLERDEGTYKLALLTSQEAIDMATKNFPNGEHHEAHMGGNLFVTTLELIYIPQKFGFDQELIKLPEVQICLDFVHSKTKLFTNLNVIKGIENTEKLIFYKQSALKAANSFANQDFNKSTLENIKQSETLINKKLEGFKSKADSKNEEISKNDIVKDLVDELGIKNHIDEFSKNTKSDSEIKLASSLKKQLSTIMKESSQLSSNDSKNNPESPNNNDIIMMKIMEMQAAMMELQAQNLKLQQDNIKSQEMIKRIELRVEVLEKLNLHELKSKIEGKFSSDLLAQAESMINSKLENALSKSSRNSDSQEIIKELVIELKNLKSEVKFLNDVIDELLPTN